MIFCILICAAIIILCAAGEISEMRRERERSNKAAAERRYKLRQMADVDPVEKTKVEWRRSK